MQRARGAARADRLVRLAVALVVVLGIFGMHALSQPGAHEPAGTASAVVGAAAQSAAMTVGAGVMHDVHPADSHGTGTGDTGSAGHGLGHMLMLCVAVLLAAAVTLLAILSRLRRVPRVWAVLPSVAVARVTRQAAPGGAGPPSVWQFSVIRC